MRADEITTKDYLLAPSSIPNSDLVCTPSGRRITTGLMELMGLLLGDGVVSDTKICISHKADASYAPHYYDVFRREFPSLKPRDGLDDIRVRYQSNNRTAYMYSVEAAREFETSGLRKTAHHKRIPGWIFKVSTEHKLAFLRGYLDADGTVKDTGEIVFHSCHKDLIEDTRHLLISAGIPCGSTLCRQAKGSCELADAPSTVVICMKSESTT